MCLSEIAEPKQWRGLCPLRVVELWKKIISWKDKCVSNHSYIICMDNEHIFLPAHSKCHCWVLWSSFIGLCVLLFLIWYWYTECPGRNVPDFGRMFLKLKYTDVTKNTYIRSWTVTEIMAREKCDLLAVPRTVPGSRDVLPVHCACASCSLQTAQARPCCDCTCKVLGSLRTTATLVRVFM